MALIHATVMSNALGRTVPLHVVLPVDKYAHDGTLMGSTQPLKTLYLLHGLVGSSVDWVTGTRIQRWAEDRNLAVIMPSGDNAFYVDSGPYANYGAFVGEELVALTRRMFPLSSAREDTFIAGLSMGGFGALRNGLKYHTTFGAIASLSAPLDLFDPARQGPGAHVPYQMYLGPVDSAVNTDNNPLFTARQLLRRRASGERLLLPDVYLACGAEDRLLPSNREFRDAVAGTALNVTYSETPGGHDWDYWDTTIADVLEWLPLDAPTAGMSSGNVR
ncbi:MAG: esterase family protein [Cellulomonadaceae bacterium]|jgi:S-formylglutathione hydrolase FrmB|nr:esterase family protein [Cellulomonadaceae bacterium]